MIAAGIVVTLLGFLISLASLELTAGVNARLIIVLIGLGVSLFGIVGLLNRHYLSNAIWRK
jgi:uncharacterized membrane protein YccC